VISFADLVRFSERKKWTYCVE